MKNIFKMTLAAAVLFAGVACTQVERTVFKASDAVAPIMGTVTESAKSLEIEYTPGTAGTYVVYHTIALVKAGDRDVSVSLKTSAVKDKENTLSLNFSEIQNTLLNMGFEYSSTVEYTLAARMSLQNAKDDNSRNGYVDSEKTYSNTITLPDPPKPADPNNPYAGWTESTWSVIGSISSTGNGWNKDEPMVTDGTWHVCRGLVLAPSDEFKFRNNADWGENFGGEFVEIDAEFEVTQDGANIKVTEAGTYDLFLNPSAGVAKLIVTGSNISSDPYASWTDTEEWGVIGSISSTGNGWNKDEPMLTNGTWYVCKSLELKSSDEFKFRQNADWGVNFGGDFADFGAQFEVTQDGPNIKVTEDGTFDVLLNPGEAVALIVKSGENPGI